jgi:hypothetical protein
MPTSLHYQIPKIIELIVDLNPSSVLDIGPGFGKYGFLAREYLELWDGREEYHKFIRRIDGIEAFEDYLTPVHEFIYNNVYVGDAKEVIDEIDFHYDLILLIDVLEHFVKEEGKVLIKKLLAKADCILISMPKNPFEQKDAFGNVYEIHRSKWSKRELTRLGKTFFIHDLEKYILCLGGDAIIENIKRKYYINKVKRLSNSVYLLLKS